MGELSSENKACMESHYVVHPNELPLSCPSETMAVWNVHPRIFLDIESKGQVSCPYCGAIYSLVEK
ncbi:MAG TPA: zinc-finger domain-containing protein [Methylophaga aminisulfidivorans]|uniref:Zinc-finger domain-containing protein n=1 Tax=Methylophaga aminisulfidivorans TaxID=230105 RepID=A0A7C1ZTT7_9GAMM|nr:zinc-finger domain-containing protein [Methylophaga aminisulfidivorans]